MLSVSVILHSHLSISMKSQISNRFPYTSVLIFNTHLHLALPSGLFLLHFSTKTLHTPVLTYIRVRNTAHTMCLDLTTRSRRRTNHETQCAISSTLIDRDTFLCTLRLNPLSLRSFLNVRGQD